MAKVICIGEDKEECNKTLTKALQSGNISFLIGSGASLPAIPIAGDIERRLDDLLERDIASYKSLKHDFLCTIQSVANHIHSNTQTAEITTSIENYKTFLELLGKLLEERKTKLLTKQVNLFSTNYDILIECASEAVVSVRLNDGFNRIPSTTNEFQFQPEHFFNYLQKTGNLYNYSFPVPGINLVKLHGSLTWAQKGDEIVYRTGGQNIPVKGADEAKYQAEMDDFDDSFSLILPTKSKFAKTLLERTYYDLLRVYANTLEVTNTVLFVFGFSFEDAHIFDITRRALKNPTLIIVVLAYDQDAMEGYIQKFDGYNNVLVVHRGEDGVLDFNEVNDTLRNVIPTINDED